MRTRAERRKLNAKKARRKQKISRTIYGSDWYDNLHAYSKNKIHCSCPLCAAKTNGRRLRHNFLPAYNPSISDLKRKERMESSLKEFTDSN